MLKICLITVGTIKDNNLIMLINDFKKRLKHYVDLNEIVVSNSKLNNSPDAMKFETEKIMAKIPKDYYTVLLDITGKKINSVDFAKFLKDQQDFKQAKIVFIIGGSNGVLKTFKQQVNLRWSFSDLTFPYAIFRLMLLEQIYRGCKINNNEKYHK